MAFLIQFTNYMFNPLPFISANFREALEIMSTDLAYIEVFGKKTRKLIN